MVHFYNEVTQKELYSIRSQELKDILFLKESLVKWIKVHPENVDETF